MFTDKYSKIIIKDFVNLTHPLINKTFYDINNSYNYLNNNRYLFLPIYKK